MLTYQELKRQIKFNVNHNWTMEDNIYEYTENNGYLPNDMKNIYEFIFTMEEKYRIMFFNMNVYEVGKKGDTWELRKVVYNAFIAVIKESIIDYFESM